MQIVIVPQIAKIFGASLVLSLVLFVFLPMITAQPQLGHTLRGKVYLPGNGNQPKSSARIQLLTKGSIQAETVTDSGGTYMFSQVVNGNYQLVVPSDGQTFSTTIVDVQIFFMSGNRLPQLVTQDVFLTAKDSDIKVAPKTSEEDRKLDASIPKDAKKAYEKGSKSAKKGNMTEALEQLNTAIQIHPAYFDAHMALGELYAKNHDLAAAQTAFSHAIEIKPKSSEPYFHLGVVLVKNHKSSEAVEKLRQAMELGDKSANSYMFLGVALMDTNAYEEAEKMLLKALDIGGNAGVRIYLADCYERWGKKGQCIEQLEAYVRLAPTASNVPDIENLIKQLKEKK